MPRGRRGTPKPTGRLELDLFETGGGRRDEKSKRKAKDSSAVRRASAIPPPEPSRLERIDDLGDQFPGSSARSAVPISTLTETAREIVESAFLPIWVHGEIIDFKPHRNGNWYFCLRDEWAQIRCVVFAKDRRAMPAPPDDGMQVVALGQLTVYPARGDMQLIVRRLEARGDGLWRKAVELTHARLAADGLLAPERKRGLPRHPRRIAVVTSPDGAALHDVVSVVRRRAPWVELVLVSTAVQGDLAPEQIVDALDRVARWRACDLVILGRGGGARDDLRAFNDERVARAVAGCPIPIISAVGHEIDVTLCDLVADLRAATPSAAAEAAVRSGVEIAAELASLAGRLRGAVQLQLAAAGDRVRHAEGTLRRVTERHAERRRASIRALSGRLNALSPLATLARGYAVARDDSGRVLSTVSRFAEGMAFDLLLRDGRVGARAESVAPTPRPIEESR